MPGHRRAFAQWRNCRRQSLIDLREGSFRTAESLQQALKITRLLIGTLLPEGLKSRQVLEQIRQFDRNTA